MAHVFLRKGAVVPVHSHEREQLQPHQGGLADGGGPLLPRGMIGVAIFALISQRNNPLYFALNHSNADSSEDKNWDKRRKARG
jgi:hypothetical protein